MKTVILNRSVRRRLASWLLLPVLIGCAQPSQPPPAGPRAQIDPAVHDFGEVPQGKPVRHLFKIRNVGSEDLMIEGVAAPAMVDVKVLDDIVPPGGEGRVEAILETSGRVGSGDLPLKIRTNDPAQPEIEVRLRGRLVTLVEIKPQNRLYFFNVLRGDTARQDLTIVNHQNIPLKVLEVEKDDDSAFGWSLETLEEGQTYTLTVELRDTRRTERRIEERLILVTDSPDLPRFPIRVLATLENLVDTRPQQVSWSQFRLEDLAIKPVAEKRVRVAKRSSADFQILVASTDVDFIDVEVVPESAGQSYIVHLRIDPEKARRGEFEATLKVGTNDPDFPELTVPLTGTIL